MVVTVGITFISDMSMTRKMFGVFSAKACLMGSTFSTFSSLNAGVSGTRRRISQPAMMTMTESRKGTRQPQEVKASSGSSRANGMKAAAARIWPAWVPCRVKEAKKPRRP